MKVKVTKGALLVVFCFLGVVLWSAQEQENTASGLIALLPEVGSWSLTETPESYYPENLFEYINGAAEIYLSYEFKELIVAQQHKGQSGMNVAVEIYDMGNGANAFGIYSAERYPDNRYIQVGLQGYLEEGTLNFLVDRYYVKLLCFDCGSEADEVLKTFARKIVKKVGNTGNLPLLLKAFPPNGLQPHSENFILRNFMGYSFLHNGYSAKYQLDDLEFDCFLVEGKDDADANEMLQKYLEAKGSQNVQEIDLGYHIRNKYYKNIYISRVSNKLCGVMKIEEGREEVGLEYLESLVGNLNKMEP